MTENKVKEILLKRMSVLAEKANITEVSTLTLALDTLGRVGRPDQTASFYQSMMELMRQKLETSEKEANDDK